MSHLLMRHDWMFSAVQKPWHGIGTVTDGVLTAAEAIRAAKLDWTVGQDPLFRFQPFDLDGINNAAHVRDLINQLKTLGVPVQVGNMRALLNHIANVREDLPFEDPASDLGVVTRTYAPIQNAACFKLCDRIIGRLGARYETAGSLMSGKRVFLTAVCPKDLKVADDIVRPYLLISTAHDATGSLDIKLVIMRVVCWNTLSAALAETTSATARVKHTAGSLDGDGNVRQSIVQQVKGDITAKIEQDALSGNAANGDVAAADALISVTTEFFSRQVSVLNELAQRTVTRHFVDDFLHVMVPAPLGKDKSTRTDNRRQQIADIFHGTMPGDATRDNPHQQQAIAYDRNTGSGTAYRLLNAVTHFNDHEATTRQTKDKSSGVTKTLAEARFARIMKLGDFRDQASDILMEALDSDGKSLKDALTKWREAREEHLTRQLITN